MTIAYDGLNGLSTFRGVAAKSLSEERSGSNLISFTYFITLSLPSAACGEYWPTLLIVVNVVEVGRYSPHADR